MRTLNGDGSIGYGTDIYINPNSIDVIMAYVMQDNNGTKLYSQIKTGGFSVTIPVLFENIDEWINEVTRKRPLNIREGGNV